MSVRLRAECLDCPKVHNTDWGYDEPVSKEAVDETIVKAWAWQHVYSKAAETAGPKGHRLKFSSVVRVPINVKKLNPKLLRLMFEEAS